jgi:hypothetical protein
LQVTAQPLRALPGVAIPDATFAQSNLTKSRRLHDGRSPVSTKRG